MILQQGMGDFALVWDNTTGQADMAIVDDDVLDDDGLRTAVLLSLFVDRRAEDGDALPAGDGDRRGWFGDELLEVEGDRIGSRLWLLDRAKLTERVVPDAEAYALEALAWLLEDRVAESVEASAQVVDATGDGLRDLLWDVTVRRPDEAPAQYQFAHVWDAELGLG